MVRHNAWTCVCDVDGDALGARILLSNIMGNWANNFEPHNNIPAVDSYRINSHLHLPNTTILTVANYLNKDEPEDETCSVFDEIVDLDMQTA